MENPVIRNLHGYRFIFFLLSLFLILCIPFQGLAQSSDVLYQLVSRGKILGVDGTIYAESTLRYNATIIPNLVSYDNSAHLYQIMARQIGVSVQDIMKQVEESDPDWADYPVRIKENISETQYTELRRLEDRYTAIYAEEEFLRRYPQRSMAAHVIGYVETLSDEQFNALYGYGYDRHDTIGMMGLERYYEDDLRAGYNVHTTLKKDVQQLLERFCDFEAGTCIAVDGKSGDILGLVSRPTFNPNYFAPPQNIEGVEETLKTNGAFYNRAIQMSYPPGSNFKIVTAVAGLHYEIIDATTTFRCMGSYRINPNSRTFHCHILSGHGTQNIVGGLQYSCNVFFYNLAYETGREKIVSIARDLGFGSPTQITLPFEKSGLLPTRSWINDNRDGKWYDGETLLIGIGQGPVAVTPLQMVMAYHTIANKGKHYKPRLVTKIQTERDVVEYETQVLEELTISESIFDTIIEGLKRVTQQRGGTANSAFRGCRHNVAGKTGSAELGNGTIHTWFTGFAPANDPELVLVVFVENGVSGELTSAPIARRILDAYFR